MRAIAQEESAQRTSFGSASFVNPTSGRNRVLVGVVGAPANPCDGHFMRGDEVFGFVSGGGFAEYLSKLEELLARKPAKLSFQQAATVPLAALNAHQQHLSN